MIWMLDTNILIYLTNRKPGFEKIARRMSGRSPGEVRLSAITLAELRFGIEKGEFRTQNKAALESLLELLQVDDFPAAAAQERRRSETTTSRRATRVISLRIVRSSGDSKWCST